MKRFDLKFERGYRFVVNPLRERMQLLDMFTDLLKQINENIRRREAQGINQEPTIVMLKQLFEKEVETPENLALFRELMIEANTQLGFFSLPEDIYGKYKEIIRVTAYSGMKEIMGEDPRKAYKRNKILADN